MYRAYTALVSVGAIFCFWPFMAGYHETALEGSAVRQSVSSPANVVASTVLLTLVVPLAFDAFIIDGVVYAVLRRTGRQPSTDLGPSRGTTQEGRDLMTHSERLLVYAGMAALPVCAFIRPSYPNLALVAECASRFQFVAIYGGVSCCASRYSPLIFQLKWCLLGLVLAAVSVNLFCYMDIFGINNGSVDFVAQVTFVTDPAVSRFVHVNA